MSKKYEKVQPEEFLNNHPKKEFIYPKIKEIFLTFTGGDYNELNLLGARRIGKTFLFGLLTEFFTLNSIEFEILYDTTFRLIGKALTYKVARWEILPHLSSTYYDYCISKGYDPISLTIGQKEELFKEGMMFKIFPNRGKIEYSNSKDNKNDFIYVPIDYKNAFEYNYRISLSEIAGV